MLRPILAILLCLLAFPALAHGRRQARHHHRHCIVRVVHHRIQPEHVSGARPADCYGIPWCGCYMRHVMGVADRAYNLARNWAHYGMASVGPCLGCIVVWPHHVGLLVGQFEGRWIVKSGNDGHAVRTRPRSLAGAIAFRYAPRHGDWGGM